MSVSACNYLLKSVRIRFFLACILAIAAPCFTAADSGAFSTGVLHPKGVGVVGPKLDCGPIAVEPPTLPSGSVGLPYSEVLWAYFEALMAPSTFLFTVTAGSLPPGFTLDSNGTLWGTPVSPGSYGFTVTATDSLTLCTGSADFTLNLACPIIDLAPAALPAGQTWLPYSQAFTASGGIAPYSYALAGMLPNGISLAGDTLLGTPTESGSFPIVVTATGANGCKNMGVAFAENFDSQLIVPPALPSGWTSGATGACAPWATDTNYVDTPPNEVHADLPYPASLSGESWLETPAISIVSPSASLHFMNLDPMNETFDGGVLEISIGGGPFADILAAGGSFLQGGYNSVINASLTNPLAGRQAWANHFDEIYFPVEVALPASAAGQSVKFRFRLGVDATSWNGGGWHVDSIVLYDGYGKNYILTVANCPTVVTVTNPALNIAPAGVLFSESFTQVGATPPVVFSTEDALPIGLALSPDGTLSGTPLQAGVFPITVVAAGADGCAGAGPLYTLAITGCGSMALSEHFDDEEAPLLPTGWISELVVPGAYTNPVWTSTAAPEFPTCSPFSPPNSATFNSWYADAGAQARLRPPAPTSFAMYSDATLTLQMYHLSSPYTGEGIQLQVSLDGGSSWADVAGGSIPTDDGSAGQWVQHSVDLSPYAGSSSVLIGILGMSQYGLNIHIDDITVTGTCIPCPTITVGPARIWIGTAGVSYSQSFTRTGGTAPVTFSLSGALPAGLTFSGSTLSGIPTQAGSFPFTITATDANGCVGTRNYTLVVSCVAIDIMPASLPTGSAGAYYEQAFSTSGGYGTATLALAGALPPGMTFISPTLSGTPTQSGTFPLTVTATDESGCSGSRDYILTISCQGISVLPEAVPAAAAGEPYSVKFESSGGSGTVTYTLSGDIPPGMAFSAGTLSGTPTQQGTYAFVVTATDDSGCTGSTAYSLVVNCPKLAVAPASLPPASPGVSYSQTLTTSPPGGGYSYALASGALPPGLALSKDGIISGTPTSSGTYSFTISITGWVSCQAVVGYTIMICNAISIDPQSLPAAIVNAPYSQSLSASGGVAPYSYAITSGSPPAGITLSPAGLLSGSPTGVGTFAFTVTASGADGCSGFKNYTLTVTGCPKIDVSPAAFPDGQQGVGYSEVVSAGGGLFTFSISSGAPPPGLALVGYSPAVQVRLQGTPSAPGSSTFTITATDQYGCAGSREYTLNIGCGQISISPSSLPRGTAWSPYSLNISASGGTPPYTFGAEGLPPGLAISPSDGMISGTPTATGAFSVAVSAIDAAGCRWTKSYDLSVACNTLDISPATLSALTVGAPFSQDLTAAPGLPPITFSVDGGSLPPGLSLSEAGTISGTPVAGGAYSFTVSAADANGCKGARSYSTSVCPAISLGPDALPPGSPGIVYSASIVASGGAAPYFFAISSGSLPPGLSLGFYSGLISGVPALVGSYHFVVGASDSNGCGASRAYTLEIACPAITLNPEALPSASAGSPYGATISAGGGTGPYTYSITSGSLPAGIAFDTSTGALSGTPTLPGTSTFAVTATDNNRCQGTRTYSISVDCSAISITTQLLATAALGQPYMQTLSASGGSAPYAWAVSAGLLPAGFSLDASGAIFCAMPLVPGDYSFQLTVADRNRCSASRVFTLKVVGYDLIFNDDYGRAEICISTQSGTFVYRVLSGSGAGSYSGDIVMTKTPSVWFLRSPAGAPYTFSADYTVSIEKATGYFSYDAYGVQSQFYDLDTTNNPPGC